MKDTKVTLKQEKLIKVKAPIGCIRSEWVIGIRCATD